MRVALPTDDKNKYFIMADISLPDGTLQALGSLPELSIKNGEEIIYPAMRTGSQAAGPGLVFQRTMKTRLLEIDHYKSELTSRVAYGWDVDDPSRKHAWWDGVKINRFHISINALRYFFPEDWKEHPHYKGKEDPENVEDLIACEEINVSFRWKDEKFETHWNGEFNWDKSTYIRANTGFSKKVPEDIRRQAGRAPRIVQFPSSFNAEETKILGYTPVFNTLTRFGDFPRRDNTTLAGITHVEGARILFEEIKPCIEQYIKR